MFNAFYDIRRKFKYEPVIRILSFIDKVEPSVKTFCQIWFKDIEVPFISEVHEYKLIWSKRWDVNNEGSQPYLVTCKNPLASRNMIPKYVSVVENECDTAANNFPVIFNMPKMTKKKAKFGICTKDLDFPEDQSNMMIEWIEILSLLGADKIFVYVISIHPNMMKVLKYYERQSFVEIHGIAEPKGLPSKNESLTQWLQNELISLNDCFYRNMYQYEFLIALDIDEIVMPMHEEDKNWTDMMTRTIAIGENLRNKTFASYYARNVFFLFDNIHQNDTINGIPDNMIFLQHIYRARNFSCNNAGAKAFQSTDHVLAMHNHFPIECIDEPECDFFRINELHGRLQHYRVGCENYPKIECDDFKQNTVKDISLWKIKDKLIMRMNRTLNALKSYKVID